MPRFAEFKTLHMSVMEHPALIRDYTQAHTEILQTQALGTFAICPLSVQHTPEKDIVHYRLKVVVKNIANQNNIADFDFAVFSHGAIQHQDLTYLSIDHFLHNNQCFYEWTRRSNG